jgi:hypothetical protein
MSSPDPSHTPGEHQPPVDAMDSIIHLVPIVLPVAGGVLIFLLAFIAVYMA